MVQKSKQKMFSTRIDTELIKGLKHLSIDSDKSVSQLTEESIKDLLKRYAEKEKGTAP